MKVLTKLYSVFIALVVLALYSAGLVNAAEVTGHKSATLRWNGVTGAESYNIYYKEKTDASFVHAVRDLNKDSRQYTIGYLKSKGVYEYKICAVKGDKTEFWCSNTFALGKTTLAKTSEAKKEVVNVPSKNVITGYAKATVKWSENEKAEHYYIYYRKVGEANWTHSVIGLDHNSKQYTINYLDKAAYEYQLVAVDGNYKPIAWSAVMRLKKN